MSNTLNIQQAAREWLDSHLNDEAIKAELMKRGFEEHSLPEMMNEIKKLRNSRKTSGGLILILAGAVLCLLSCILTLTGSYSGTSFQLVLYGITTLGILITFGGLIKIFN
ncbi:MAG: hypothetical protein ACTHKV_12075 [Flavipsychrobacter sp.]